MSIIETTMSQMMNDDDLAGYAFESSDSSTRECIWKVSMSFGL